MSVADSIVQMAQQNNAWSAEQALKQMDFQREMSNTAHQREIADLQAAGLNPVLSAKLGGASTPSGAAATADTSWLSAFVQALKEFGEGAVSSAVGAALTAGDDPPASSIPYSSAADIFRADHSPHLERSVSPGSQAGFHLGDSQKQELLALSDTVRTTVGSLPGNAGRAGRSLATVISNSANGKYADYQAERAAKSVLSYQRNAVGSKRVVESVSNALQKLGSALATSARMNANVYSRK